METKRLRTILYVSVCIVFLAVASFGVLDREHIRNQLNDWKLLPQPERLTELYFSNPNSLPSTYKANQTQNIAFTTHNLEYHREDYHYTITETGADHKSSVLGSGAFELAQNQYEHKSQPVSLTDLGSRVQVTISLTNFNESVDYLLNRSGS
ncbi:MAG TPA: hypothetical protein VGS28_01045 [Candidatus Saccharimonadales bacterium]|nr:hypothetical protein [Candidatus Saccharimonadales bacterium]